jgi:hypothetical protein
MNRRQFLVGASAVALSAGLPIPALTDTLYDDILALYLSVVRQGVQPTHLIMSPAAARALGVE